MIRRTLRILAAIGLLGAGLWTLTGTAGTAGAAGPTVTVRHHDVTGAVVSVWRGPRRQAEELVARRRSAHEPTAATKAGASASPAIERPPHCGLPTTYWVFRADNLLCYRYGGTLSIDIKHVYEVDSGNNAGYYVVSGTRYYVQKYVYDLWDPKVTVTKIHID